MYPYVPIFFGDQLAGALGLEWVEELTEIFVLLNRRGKFNGGWIGS